ncbi:PHB depolymerase family esterase [Sphingomonas sp. TREG-RG-20F-R18-01]|uniref:extracellular catalytic domain type 1 short-chain-length polyhydroxyalkanoate depolymerase n=1 Tax=Sphingomonas sp. TREG-RG-20F-R18-01 TaxID=2914982 RepID=UPI001F58615D|nr:PHB depolymerase family esterase [Sphingomonas sp. TREG-RG-20F-R18-01]
MRNPFFDAIAIGAGGTGAADRLVDLPVSGTNPGALRARAYVPARLAEHPALVVVLHGCTQTAAGYDHGSGWSRLADRHGFVLLYPEQDRTNNANLCFNWFEPGDIARGEGEALSIHQMIEAVVVAHSIERDRIFVTGLSAGGAMASVMLATYPETFAAGAIIAGLPYGCATNVQHAFGAMRSGGRTRPDALAELIRRASDHDGPWPSVSVWHGSGDATVNPDNADAIVAQWLPLHGIAGAPHVTDVVNGYPHRAWRNADGRIVVEAYSITGMGHGIPLDTNDAGSVEVAGPYMLDTAISSSQRIAEFWGLCSNTIAQSDAVGRAQHMDPAISGTDLTHRVAQARRLYPDPKPAPVVEMRRIIDDALRRAGLLK